MRAAEHTMGLILQTHGDSGKLAYVLKQGRSLASLFI